VGTKKLRAVAKPPLTGIMKPAWRGMRRRGAGRYIKSAQLPDVASRADAPQPAREQELKGTKTDAR